MVFSQPGEGNKKGRGRRKWKGERRNKNKCIKCRKSENVKNIIRKKMIEK